jgi:hypothetical protein
MLELDDPGTTGGKNKNGNKNGDVFGKYLIL